MAEMGNKIARTTQASATEYYLHDLHSTYNLVLLDLVSRDRFLKSVLCKHDEGLLLVKVHFKRAEEPLDLKDHERRLERIRRAFQGLEGSHVWPFHVKPRSAYASTGASAERVREWVSELAHPLGGNTKLQRNNRKLENFKDKIKEVLALLATL